MERSKKIWLGVFTFIPVIFLILYIIVFLFMFLGIFTTVQHGGEPNPSIFISSFVTAFSLIFIAIIAAIGMLIYYIIDITNNKNFDSNQRLMWVLILVFAGMIGNCVYWYMHIWKDTELNESVKF